MPNLPWKVCKKPSCNELTRLPNGYCDKHQGEEKRRRCEANRRYDKTRDPQVEKWRKSARFLSGRNAFGTQNPLCAECRRNGRTTPGTVLDHIVPHKGDHNLFWDVSNWQMLCAQCHNRKTASEDGGFGNPRQGEGGRYF